MRWLWRDNVVALVAVALFAAVFMVRSSDPDPGQALSLLYAIPVSLLAARWGLVSGLAAGLIACALTALWAWHWEAGVQAMGLGARFTLFLVTGLTVGLLADRIARRQGHVWGVVGIHAGVAAVLQIGAATTLPARSGGALFFTAGLLPGWGVAAVAALALAGLAAHPELAGGRAAGAPVRELPDSPGSGA